MLILKVLGAADIVAAVAIYFNINMLFLSIPLFLLHVLKGIASMGWDWTGKVYGIVDIVSAFAVLFVFQMPFAIEFVLIAVLLFKGIMSFM